MSQKIKKKSDKYLKLMLRQIRSHNIKLVHILNKKICAVTSYM